jgi:uncharacterized membrane protein
MLLDGIVDPVAYTTNAELPHQNGAASTNTVFDQFLALCEQTGPKPLRPGRSPPRPAAVHRSVQTPGPVCTVRRGVITPRGPANPGQPHQVKPTEENIVTTRVEKTVVVDVPVSTAYNQWTQFEDFPQFMSGVKQVTQLSDDRLEWVAEIVGVRRQWMAKIVEQVPDRKVAWAATEGATNAGAVTFEDLGGRTSVHLSLEYEPEGILEQLGDKLNLVESQAEGDLDRFKSFIESEGYATGAWRGSVDQGGQSGTPGVEDAAGSRGDKGKAGVSGAAVAAGVGAAAAAVAGGVAAAAAAKNKSDDHPVTPAAEPTNDAPDGGTVDSGDTTGLDVGRPLAAMPDESPAPPSDSTGAGDYDAGIPGVTPPATSTPGSEYGAEQTEDSGSRRRNDPSVGTSPPPPDAPL